MAVLDDPPRRRVTAQAGSGVTVQAGSGVIVDAGRRAKAHARTALVAALLAASSFSGCAGAPHWTAFDDRGNVSYAYDTGSVRRFSGGRARVRILEDHTASVIDRRTGQDYISSQQLWEFNCPAQTIARLEMVEYSGHKGTGTNLSSADSAKISLGDPQSLSRGDRDEAQARPESVVTGTPEAAMQKIMCE